MRVALNLVINEMIPLPPKTNLTGDRCEDPKSDDEVKNSTESGSGVERQDWTENQQSFVRAAFYIGYIPAHLPAGICADIFGARYILLACMGVSSIFTLILPLIIEQGWLVVGISRILVGAGQGMAFPAVSSLVAYWIPARERALLGSFAVSGSHIGTVTGNILSGVLVDWKDWRLPFYVFGVAGLAFMIPIFIWTWTSPQVHPFIDEKEKEMLSEEIKPKIRRRIPLGKILIDRVVWAMTIGELGHGWVFFTFNNDLPKYLSQMLRYDIMNNGFISAIPSFGMWICSICSGFLSDYLQKKKNIRPVTLRRWFTAFGNIVPGVFCILAGYAGCNNTLAVFCLVMALTTKGPFYSGIKVNYLDISKNFTGVVFSFNNSVGAIMGFLCPFIVGLITKDFLFSQWRLYFWITMGVCIVPTMIYWVMTDDKRRSWDYGEDETPETA